MFGLVPFDKRHHGIGSADSRNAGMDPFYGNFMRDAYLPFYYRGLGSRQMKVDIRETDSEYMIEADMPGITKEQVTLEIEDDMLVITASADESKETENKGYICRERRYGRTSRSFSLENVQADKITAAMENGVLSVKLPKKESQTPKGRKISIE